MLVQWWSLLDIRLDDPDDIRLASSSAAFNAVAEKFAPTRPSASIGWAPVAAVGYEFETLVNAASHAAETAYAKGGDRWERVHRAAE
ncbi:hypothetical protein DC31_02130 [Microbacterium sp. CH12i]|uniref:hypothetical protein n=1 Tax=Microbacterium sp. CH12i TaxID=1479651 RepID=UPI0004620102|nr:hypothetical protein [Microbacterium sp. CH12i]KDA05216.1 hypothetical protein DC31_02130 [Microbacterium sp. CH12i]